MSSSTSDRYASGSISPTQGPEHFLMWNNRHGLPSRSWRRSLGSEHVRMGRSEAVRRAFHSSWYAWAYGPK